MPDSESADRLIHVALTLILPVHRSLNVGDEAGRDDVLSTVFLIQYRQPSVKLEQKISLDEGAVRIQAGTCVSFTAQCGATRLGCAGANRVHRVARDSRRCGGEKISSQMNLKSNAPGKRPTRNPGARDIKDALHPKSNRGSSRYCLPPAGHAL